MGQTPSPARRAFGLAFGCGALFFVSAGACGIGSAIFAMSGGSTAITFDCTRATGQCVLNRGLDETIDLASIQGAEVVCDEVHTGSGATTYENQCNLYATTASGRRALASDSGDPSSESEYRAAAAQIQAFVSGTEPTLHTSYTARMTTSSSLEDVFSGVGSLFIGVILAYVFVQLRRKPA